MHAIWKEGAEAHYVDAAYYDQCYRLRRKDKDYYARECEGSVLELGCGTGRITLPIARTGNATVFGVDAMPQMLARAEAKRGREPKRVKDRVRFEHHDFIDVRLGERFDQVIAPFNALMHLYTRDEFERCMTTVREHLKPGGHFLFDILVPDAQSLARKPDRVYRIGRTRLPSTGKRYHYRERFSYDPRTQVQSIELIFVGVDDPLDLHVVPLTHRHYFPEELAALLHYNGFEALRHDGDFGGGDIDQQSESQVVVARLR